MLSVKKSKGLSKYKCSRITLTNNKIKDVMKVINSLENRGILLKGTTKKNCKPKRRISQFS